MPLRRAAAAGSTVGIIVDDGGATRIVAGPDDVGNLSTTGNGTPWAFEVMVRS